VSYPEAIDYRDRTTVFSELGVVSDGELVVVGNDGALSVAEVMSAGMFSLLDIPPALGRSFGPGDDAPGAEPVVMLCDATWEQRFGRDPGVLGRTVRINGLPATIVGVAPRAFRGTLVLFSTDYLLPLETGRRAVASHAYEDRNERAFRLFARLKPGLTIEEARVRLAATAAVLGRTYPTTNAGRTVTALSAAAVRFDPNLDRAMLPVSAIVTVASGLVLLVACSNLAGLLLVRASSRVREIGTRVAMGASRLQVLRLLLVESALLGLLGGLAGIALARLLASSLGTIPDWLPVPMNLDFRIDAKNRPRRRSSASPVTPTSCCPAGAASPTSTYRSRNDRRPPSR
jgi:putative ABC transport system permease protein